MVGKNKLSKIESSRATLTLPSLRVVFKVALIQAMSLAVAAYRLFIGLDFASLQRKSCPVLLTLLRNQVAAI